MAEFESAPTRLEIELRLASLARQEQNFANEVEREREKFLSGLAQAQREFYAGIATAREELLKAMDEIAE